MNDAPPDVIVGHALHVEGNRRANERTPSERQAVPAHRDHRGRSTPETFATVTDNSAAPVLAKYNRSPMAAGHTSPH